MKFAIPIPYVLTESFTFHFVFLLQFFHRQKGGNFIPQVSLSDGLSAVEMGMVAQMNVTNRVQEDIPRPLAAFSTKSSEHLLNLAIAQVSIQPQGTVLEDTEYNDGNYYEEEKG